MASDYEQCLICGKQHAPLGGYAMWQSGGGGDLCWGGSDCSGFPEDEDGSEPCVVTTTPAPSASAPVVNAAAMAALGKLRADFSRESETAMYDCPECDSSESAWTSAYNSMLNLLRTIEVRELGGEGKSMASDEYPSHTEYADMGDAELLFSAGVRVVLSPERRNALIALLEEQPELGGEVRDGD